MTAIGFALAAWTALVAAVDAPMQPPTTSSITIVEGPSPPPDPAAKIRSGDIARAAGFRGVIGVTRGPRRTILEHIGTGPDATIMALWPWASVTKQVLAILVMQEVAAGRLALDAPAGRYLPALGGAAGPTVRQLLQHRSGLRNPDDSIADASGGPGFYTSGPTGLGWCLEGRGTAGGNWRYNNCDYLVLGAMLERSSGHPLARLIAERIAGPARAPSLRFADGLRPEQLRWFRNGPTADELHVLRRYGAAGGLVGNPDDMLQLDRALLDGRLLPQSQRDILWAGDPALGYMALGQWSFSAPLRGCDGPVRLIERRGGIGRFQVRNIIAPEIGEAVVILTNDGNFEFGEIWQQAGFSYDILSAELCG